MDRVRAQIAKNLRRPGSGLIGMYLMNIGFRNLNGHLERNAVKLCNIEPHHTVLEVGFGPGIGIQAALEKVRDGSGKVHGADWSPYCCSLVSENFKKDMNTNKLFITPSSVLNLPYDDNEFDRVFHTNCYFFWQDMQGASAELYRVMKPNSYMVTCLDMDQIKEYYQKGYLKGHNPDPINYMFRLEEEGFVKCKSEYLTCETTGKKFLSLVAHMPKQKTENMLIAEMAKHELDSQYDKEDIVQRNS